MAEFGLDLIMECSLVYILNLFLIWRTQHRNLSFSPGYICRGLNIMSSCTNSLNKDVKRTTLLASDIMLLIPTSPVDTYAGPNFLLERHHHQNMIGPQRPSDVYEFCLHAASFCLFWKVVIHQYCNAAWLFFSTHTDIQYDFIYTR